MLAVPFYRYDYRSGTSQLQEPASAVVTAWFSNTDATHCPVTSWTLTVFAGTTYGGGLVTLNSGKQIVISTGTATIFSLYVKASSNAGQNSVRQEI